MDNATNLDLEKILLAKRVIYFDQEITEKSCNNLLLLLEYLNAMDTQPISLKMNCNGGNVFTGGFVKDSVKNSIAPIECLAVGYVCSMATRHWSLA